MSDSPRSGADGRPHPQPTPETAAFWAGTRAGELRIQRCRVCGRASFPPVGGCPRCGSADVVPEVASGRGRILSAVVSHLSVPGREPPFVLAVVELAEGAQLLTNVVDVEPALAAVPPDLPVALAWEPLGDVALPVFRPDPW